MDVLSEREQHMNTAEYAKSSLEAMLGLVGTCAGGMDDSQYNWKPGGTANSAAKSHVHALTSMDFFINGAVQGKPLLWPEVAAQHNLPANPMEIWGFDGPIPVDPIKEYAANLQAGVLAHIGSLSDADFDREVETQFFGKKSVAFLVSLAGMHAVGHAGDMAAVKGMQGLKGLPF
jgi:hypothetical protein